MQFADGAGHPLDEQLALTVVDGLDRGEQRRRDPDRLRLTDSHRHLMRQAGATEADARSQEAPADPRVMGHACNHTGDVRPVRVAQLRQLVGEADLRREEEVGPELGQGRVGGSHFEDRRVRPAVDLAEHGGAAAVGVVRDADDDPVGLQEVADRRAFARELRVGHDRDRAPSGLMADRVDEPRQLTDEVGRQGRADHYRGVVRHLRDDRGQGALDRCRLPAAIPVMGAHGDEDDLGGGHGAGRRGREAQAPGFDTRRDELFEAGLVDRHPTDLEFIEPAIVAVDADDVVAPLRQARSSN